MMSGENRCGNAAYDNGFSKNSSIRFARSCVSFGRLGLKLPEALLQPFNFPCVA